MKPDQTSTTHSGRAAGQTGLWPDEMSGSSREQTQQILRARAKALSRPLEEPQPASGVDLLVFSVDSERYGIELPWIREVLPVPELVAVPHTPQWVAGVMGHHGRVVTVLGLRSWLGLFDESEAPPPQSRVIAVVEAPGMTFALLVDALEGVVRSELTSLEAQRAKEGALPSLVRGVTPERVAVLDVAALTQHLKFRVSG